VEDTDGIVLDGVKDELYGTNSETVLLDGDRSYNISAVKTDSGVYIYAQGIFNTNVDNQSNQGWANKTNFEFKLNGGGQSYVNVLNESNGVTNFNYKVELLPSGKYQHTVEIFVAKALISNWSDTGDVQINYAWKTPNEKAYIISDMLDYRHVDWNTDWHSYHRLGGLTTYYVPLQANLFISNNGLVSSNVEGIDGIISSNEYSGTPVSVSKPKTNVEVNGKVLNGDLYLAFTIVHNNWSVYNNGAGNWWKNDNIEMYVNGEKIVILFLDGEFVIPSQITQGKSVTTTNSDGKLVTVVELCIDGDLTEYQVQIGMNGTGFEWVGVMWNPTYGIVTENGITIK
jgi:hypothetical protein